MSWAAGIATATSGGEVVSRMVQAIGTTLVCFILIITPAALSAQTVAPRVWSWLWDGPTNLELVRFQWRRADIEVCASCGWLEIEGWTGEQAPRYWALAFPGDYVGPIEVRALVNDGTAWLATDASNSVPQPTCATLDVDGDGSIGMSEFGALKRWFGQQCPAE